MKILAFIGSPRKHGNTDILVDAFLNGAQENGHKAAKLYLYDYAIRPCIDCRKCKRGKFHCNLKDDMQRLYPQIDASDLLVFGTPVYWFGPTAQTKLLVDRLRPYVASKGLSGKSAVVVSPAGDGPKVCDPMIRMFQMTFEYLQMACHGTVLAEAFEKGEVLEDTGALDRAYNLGRTFQPAAGQ